LKKHDKLDPEAVHQAKLLMEKRLFELGNGVKMEELQKKMKSIVSDMDVHNLSLFIAPAICQDCVGMTLVGHEEAMEYLFLEAVRHVTENLLLTRLRYSVYSTLTNPNVLCIRQK